MHSLLQNSERCGAKHAPTTSPTTKKVSHPIWPMLSLNPCAFCCYSTRVSDRVRVQSHLTGRPGNTLFSRRSFTRSVNSKVFRVVSSSHSEKWIQALTLILVTHSSGLIGMTSLIGKKFLMTCVVKGKVLVPHLAFFPRFW